MRNCGEVLREVEIDNESTNKIQRVAYELDGYRNLLRSIVADNGFKYDEEAYRWIMKDYQAANAEYKLRIAELQALYAPDLEGPIIVDVNFITNTAKFIKEGVCHEATN